MSNKKTRIRQEDRSASADYAKKAEDNYLQMLSAVQAGNYNAASTLAIQCIISSADALCVYEKGIRSVSQDHLDVCDLVAALPIQEAPERSKLLKKVIAKKNLVQYERRNIFRDEALDVVKITARFYQWVQECIKK